MRRREVSPELLAAIAPEHERVDTGNRVFGPGGFETIHQRLDLTRTPALDELKAVGDGRLGSRHAAGDAEDATERLVPTYSDRSGQPTFSPSH